MLSFQLESLKGVIFRRWASALIKQYLIKGYATDQRRLDHYDEFNKDNQ